MSRPRLCAVIPTFDPGSYLIRCTAALAKQVDRIFLIDDGSQASFEPLLRDLEARGMSLHREPANRGIASALNRGVRLAMESGFEWVLTFDQDSEASADLVERLFAALDACPDAARVAMVGPRIVHPERHRQEPTSNALPYRRTRQLLTSGSLVRTAALRDVGFFDESFVIDRVDFEICARLRAAGYLLLEATRTKLAHAPGKTRHVRFLGRTFRLQSHNYKRRYYMARNDVWLARRYGLRDPLWVLRRIGGFGMQWGTIALFEDDKRRKLGASVTGLLDGLRGRSGQRFADMRVVPRDAA